MVIVVLVLLSTTAKVYGKYFYNRHTGSVSSVRIPMTLRYSVYPYL